jgi:hypothetical protein
MNNFTFVKPKIVVYLVIILPSSLRLQYTRYLRFIFALVKFSIYHVLDYLKLNPNLGMLITQWHSVLMEHTPPLLRVCQNRIVT